MPSPLREEDLTLPKTVGLGRKFKSMSILNTAFSFYLLLSDKNQGACVGHYYKKEPTLWFYLLN